MGGFGAAGINKFGIEIEVRTAQNFGTDRVSGRTLRLTRQEALYQEVLKTLERVGVSSSDSYKLAGNYYCGKSLIAPTGRDWKVGDVVNVSRPTHDGGAFTLGIVTRIYPYHAGSYMATG